MIDAKDAADYAARERRLKNKKPADLATIGDVQVIANSTVKALVEHAMRDHHDYTIRELRKHYVLVRKPRSLVGQAVAKLVRRT